ncbi:MAG: hypothetical protein DELT_01697 [Desulfovibrio sp.]
MLEEVVKSIVYPWTVLSQRYPLLKLTRFFIR